MAQQQQQQQQRRGHLGMLSLVASGRQVPTLNDDSDSYSCSSENSESWIGGADDRGLAYWATTSDDEDLAPTPENSLENVARSIPSAMATIIKHLGSKNEIRPLSCSFYAFLHW